VRKQQRAFGQGACEFLPVENRAALAVVRTFAEETILAIHSLSPAEQHISLDLRRWSGARVHDLLAARTLREVTPDPHPLALPPYGYLWLKLESSS
jgi:hypothetical protein